MTEHKQRNNDSKIARVLNQNYQRLWLSVADSGIRFGIPPLGRSRSHLRLTSDVP